MDSVQMEIGTATKKEYQTVKKGDVLSFVTGGKCTFLEMRRSRFLAKEHSTGKNITVPLYRDKAGNIPFITAIVGTDDSIMTRKANPDKFKPGQLFSINKHKETFMYSETRGVNTIGICLATKQSVRIRTTDFTFEKVDIAAIKAEIMAGTL